METPTEIVSLAKKTELVEKELTQELKLPALAPEDKTKVDTIKNEINLQDAQMSVQYGVNVQKKIADFADNILDQVKAKDAGHVGELLTTLMNGIRDIDVDSLSTEKKGFFAKLFGSAKGQADKFMTRYQKIGNQIEGITGKLDDARMQLLRDVVMLDNLFDRNLEYFHDLNLYILAGEAKIREAQEKTIPELDAKAKSSGDMIDAQKANDFRQLVQRFEKRVHDLKLTRTITLQTIPQIRIVQGNNQELVTKIQSSILNTIPLWKNQIVIAISLFRQQAAAALQKNVTDTTNELLTKNAALLKQNAVTIATESERGIVDIETLKKVNSDLISTIEETIQIQQQGRQKRAVVEKELVTIENDLKSKMLSLKPGNAPT